MADCKACRGTGNLTKGVWIYPNQDCDYCGGTGEDLATMIAEAEEDLAQGRTVSFDDVFKEGSDE